MMINLSKIKSFLSSIQYSLENIVYFCRDYFKGMNDSINIHDNSNNPDYTTISNQANITEAYICGRVSGDILILTDDLRTINIGMIIPDLQQLAGDLSYMEHE